MNVTSFKSCNFREDPIIKIESSNKSSSLRAISEVSNRLVPKEANRAMTDVHVVVIPSVDDSEEDMLLGFIWNQFAIKDDAFDNEIFEIHQQTQNLSYRGSILAAARVRKKNSLPQDKFDITTEKKDIKNSWTSIGIQEIDKKSKNKDFFSCLEEIDTEDFESTVLLNYIDANRGNIKRNGKLLTEEEFEDLRSSVLKAYPNLVDKFAEEKTDAKSTAIIRNEALEKGIRPEEKLKGGEQEAKTEDRAFSEAFTEAHITQKILDEKRRQERLKEAKEEEKAVDKQELKREIVQEEIERGQRRAEENARRSKASSLEG